MADLRFQRTERIIQETFLRLLKTTPYEQLSITQLAKESLIDRSTFYAHYQSLYELAVALVDQELAQLTAILESRESVPATASYAYLNRQLVEPLLAHQERLELLDGLSLGRQSFRPRLRQVFTRVYAEVTGLSEDDFTIYLLVNLGLSNFDYILAHHRAPKKEDIQQALKQMESLVQ